MKSNKQVRLLQDKSVYTELESNIRGRLTNNIKGKVTFNNNYLPTYDLQKPLPTGVFSDLNTLYTNLFLVRNYKIGDFKEFGEEEISKFKIREIVLKGNRCHLLIIDFEIPNDKKSCD